MSVFISHKMQQRGESKPVAAVKKALSDAAVQWFDVRDFRVGDSLPEQVRAATQCCNVCVFVATKQSMASDWCSAELGAFWGQGKPVIVYEAQHGIEQSKLAPHLQHVLRVNTLDGMSDAVRIARDAYEDSDSAKLKRFLGPMGDDERTCVCALSAFLESHTKYRERKNPDRTYIGTTVSPEDTTAATYLCSLITQVRSFNNLVVKATGGKDDEEFSEAVRVDIEHNWLLVGSSLTNSHTDWALRDDTPLTFDLDPFCLKSRRGGLTWWPNDRNPGAADPGDDRGSNDRTRRSGRWEAGKRNDIDYAMLQKVTRYGLAGERKIIVAAGLGPVGSKGAAYFLYKRWKWLYEMHEDRDFAMVLRFGGRTVPFFNDPTVVCGTNPKDIDKWLTGKVLKKRYPQHSEGMKV